MDCIHTTATNPGQLVCHETWSKVPNLVLTHYRWTSAEPPVQYSVLIWQWKVEEPYLEMRAVPHSLLVSITIPWQRTGLDSVSSSLEMRASQEPVK